MNARNKPESMARRTLRKAMKMVSIVGRSAKPAQPLSQQQEDAAPARPLGGLAGLASKMEVKKATPEVRGTARTDGRAQEPPACDPPTPNPLLIPRRS